MCFIGLALPWIFNKILLLVLVQIFLFRDKTNNTKGDSCIFSILPDSVQFSVCVCESKMIYLLTWYLDACCAAVSPPALTSLPTCWLWLTEHFSTADAFVLSSSSADLLLRTLKQRISALTAAYFLTGSNKLPGEQSCVIRVLGPDICLGLMLTPPP